MPHDTRDAVVDYVRHWSCRAELPAKQLLAWLGLRAGKFHHWQKRYGRPNNHNGRLPRDGWLTDTEKQAILDYQTRFPLEGYRRLAFMMLDDDVVAVSPSSVYRVLKQAGRLDRKWRKPSQKGRGFVQPLSAFVDHYNQVRLHSALGYLTPADKLAGLAEVIFAERDRKLEAARALRHQQQAALRRSHQQATANPLRHDATEHRERLAGVQGAGNEATWSPEPATMTT